MKSTNTVLFGFVLLSAICCAVADSDASPPLPAEDEWKFGCPAIIDDTVTASCVDSDGATNNCSEYSYQDTVATLSCKPGYEIVPDPGYNTVTCVIVGGDSVWSKPVYSCTKELSLESIVSVFGCPSIQEATLTPTCRSGNKTIDCTTGGSRLPPGTVATLTCKQGYESRPRPGYDTVTCGDKQFGEWSNTIYKCVPAPVSRLPHRQPPSPVLPHRNRHLINGESCGQLSLLDVRGLNPGNTASLDDSPWMALLTYQSTRRSVTSNHYYCSGSVISSRYVLTSASCVANIKSTVTLVSVRLGVLDSNATEFCSVSDNRENCDQVPREVSIESTVVHPGFLTGMKKMVIRDNVALLRLAEPIQLDLGHLKPVCLPVAAVDRTRLFNREMLTLAGWGLENSRKDRSPLLRVTTLPTVPTPTCKTQYASANRRHEASSIAGHHVCVGGGSTVDSCVSDRGSPVVHLGLGDLGSRMVQYGIQSFGPRCNAEVAVPIAVTRVAPYVNWILDNMRET